MASLIYTNILHNPRKILGLSVMEYVVCDMVYHLSNNPKYKWCIMTRDNMGKEVGLSKQGLMKVIERLILDGLIEKDEQTKFIRTTQKRYDTCIKDGKQSSPMVNDIYYNGKQSLQNSVNKVYQDGKQSLPNIYSNIHTDNIEIVSKETTPDGDKQEISEIENLQSENVLENESFGVSEQIPENHEIVKEYGNKDVNIFIDIIKKECKSLGLIYVSKNDRNFAKHLSSSSRFGDFCESIGKSRIDACVSVMRASVSIGYWRGACSGPESIYREYANVYNQRKQKNEKTKSNLIVVPQSAIL